MSSTAAGPKGAGQQRTVSSISFRRRSRSIYVATPEQTKTVPNPPPPHYPPPPHVPEAANHNQPASSRPVRRTSSAGLCLNTARPSQRLEHYPSARARTGNVPLRGHTRFNTASQYTKLRGANMVAAPLTCTLHPLTPVLRISISTTQRAEPTLDVRAEEDTTRSNAEAS